MNSCLMRMSLICGLGLGLSSFAAEPEPMERGFLLISVGEVNADLMERVRAFVEQNTCVRTRWVATEKAPAETLEDTVKKVLPKRSAKDVVTLALILGDIEAPAHAVYLYDEHAGAVHLQALREGEPDEEVYARRVEKVTMRSLGLLIEVTPVPNPQSAMFVYQTIEELDWMGRNFDPPSLLQFQQNLRERNVPLIADCPFNMLGPTKQP